MFGHLLPPLVPRLRLGTHRPRGSASLPGPGRRSLPISAFPGGAWERAGGAGCPKMSQIVTPEKKFNRRGRSPTRVLMVQFDSREPHRSRFMSSPVRWIAFGLLAFSAAARAADTPRPNIVVIPSDDMGFSDRGCYGGEIHT